MSGTVPPRSLCKHGANCYQQGEQHARDFAHPKDADYLNLCRAAKVEPEFVTVRMVYEWLCGPFGSRARREEVEKAWHVLQRFCEGLGQLTDEQWRTLDTDGNDYVNYGEFCEFMTLMKTRLPLGFDAFLKDGNAVQCCGVATCDCKSYQGVRPKCKEGATCRDLRPEHVDQFAHPWEPDWDAMRNGKDMCRCGHMRRLHASAAVGAASVPYPRYWKIPGHPGDEFHSIREVPKEDLAKFQSLFDATYLDITTRVRLYRNGGNSWMVPRNFQVVSVQRNENSKFWRKYVVRRGELKREKDAGLRYKLYDDIMSTTRGVAFDRETLATEVNEMYLFHGTSKAAAMNICYADFKMQLAGSSSFAQYGRGVYLAESITKADEAAKDQDGVYVVLLCRVLGGNVRYCDDREPDAEQLTRDCLEGEFGCIMADRRKVSKTYREVVVFDTENIYPEYIVKYRRGEFFKSASCPP